MAANPRTALLKGVKNPVIKKADKKITTALSNIKAVRQEATLNQSDFWTPLGVTQSGGSRYESGRGMDKPLRMLIGFVEAGIITREDLADMGKIVG